VKHIFFVLGISLFIASTTPLRALPADFGPPTSVFGDCDRDGTLVVTDDLRQADFGGGLMLPVRWIYSSANKGSSPYGWDGFSLTVLESKAVKETAILYQVTLPCGKTLYFNKQSLPTGGDKPVGGTDNPVSDGGKQNDSGGKGVPSQTMPTHWLSNDGQWKGVETFDGVFTITRWDNWELQFNQGKIFRMTTDEGRMVGWEYDEGATGIATRVYDVASGNTVIQLGVSSSGADMLGSSVGRGAHSITVNGDTYLFGYSGGTLETVDFPDGRSKQWHFEPQGGGAKRLTLTQETGWWKSWVIDTTSGYLKSDDIWNYTIRAADSSKKVVYNRPSMQRTRIATGESEKIEYQDSNSVEKKTDVLGNITTTYNYQSVGKLYGQAYKIEYKRAGEATTSVLWRGAYDASTGYLVSSYDSDNNETTYTYEGFSGASEFQPPQRVTTIRPLGRYEILERDIKGNVISLSNSAWVKRYFEWDTRHRLKTIKNADGDILASFMYGEKNQLLMQKDALGNSTTYEYILHLGEPQLTKITTPQGRVTTLSRDGMGRVASLTMPSGSTWHYTYLDDWGVVERVTGPTGAQSSYAYDARLNQIRAIDPLNNTTSTSYDDLNLPIQITDALGAVVSLQNNAQGNLTRLTDTRNKVYNLVWQGDSQRSEFQWPDAAAEHSTYDINGRLSNWSARGGEATATLNRNELGEITSRNWSYGSQSGVSSFVRNGFGQVESSTSTTTGEHPFTVGQTYGYDEEGRLSTISQSVDGTTRTTTLDYDANGTVNSIRYPAGFTASYDYNDDGQVTAIKKDNTTLATYSYDTAGRLSQRTLANGVTTSYSYDLVGQVTGITVAKGAVTLWAERYGYDPSGQRISTLKGTTGSLGAAYSYDAMGQLTGSIQSSTNATITSSWDYDSAGNRISTSSSNGTNALETSYSVNAINQYSAVGNTSLGYNSRGDLAGMGDWSYSYDAFGNLSKATQGTNALVLYARDGLGHRALKVNNGTTEILFNLGSSLLEDFNTSSNAATSYIYEPGIDHPLAEVLPDGSVRYLHQDVLGSVVMVSDSNGAPYQSYSYDAWGKVTAKDSSGNVLAASAIASPFLFTGREYDSATGLYDYRARTYSPELGRFLQMDPIKFEGGDANIFRYCGNDPVNWIDPSGRNPIAGAIAGVEGGFIVGGPAGAILGGVGGILLGAELLHLADELIHHQQEENNAVDGGGQSCPASDLEPTGAKNSQPSTKRGNKGGTSVQEGFVDKQGRPVTRHTIYGPGGNVVEPPHYRPGGFK